jgi:enamine deaminase RidA (YjgF/YER057c/UK114 family)
MKRIRLAGQLAEPIGPCTDGVEAGGFLYVSAMLPLDANGDFVGAGDVVRHPGVRRGTGGSSSGKVLYGTHS